jgi:hypothetical protein
LNEVPGVKVTKLSVRSFRSWTIFGRSVIRDARGTVASGVTFRRSMFWRAMSRFEQM